MIIYRTTPYDDNYLTYLNKLGEDNWIFGRTYWVGYFNGSFNTGLFIYLLWKLRNYFKEAERVGIINY